MRKRQVPTAREAPVRWFAVFALAGLIGGSAVPLGRAAQPDCKFYKVTAPILDVREAADKLDRYIDILEGGDIACVTREQDVSGEKAGYVEYRVPPGGEQTPVKGWVGLRYMVAAQQDAAPPQAPAPSAAESGDLRFGLPVPEGPYPVRGKSLQELAQWQPLFSPIDGLDESLWKKTCTTCHKWNQERLCEQGSSYIKSAKAIFRHQHPYGGPYKLALMRWAKAGCK